MNFYILNRILSQFERLITFSKIVAPYEIGYFNKIVPPLFCYSYLIVPLFNSFIENIFLLSHFLYQCACVKFYTNCQKFCTSCQKFCTSLMVNTTPSLSHFPLTYIYNKHIANPVYVFYTTYIVFFCPKNCTHIFCINSFIFLYICFLYNLYSVKFTEKLQFLKMYKYTKKMHKYTFFKFR